MRLLARSTLLLACLYGCLSLHATAGLNASTKLQELKVLHPEIEGDDGLEDDSFASFPRAAQSVVRRPANSRRLKRIVVVSCHQRLLSVPGASKLSETEIQRALEKGSIPPIVHQTWKNHEIPELYKQWSATWSRVNTGWLHVVWSDEENRKLVEQHYPSFLRFYDSLPLNICRVDTARALILHRYGGVYTDLDSEALRPMEQLLQGKEVVLGRMGYDFNSQQSIPNAFMASLPDQHFWLYFLKVIEQYEGRHTHKKLQVEDVAGPMALKTAVDTYSQMHVEESRASNVTVLPPGTVYPIDWSAKKHGTVPNICDWGGHRSEFDAAECIKKHHPLAYSVQWWTHGWR